MCCFHAVTKEHFFLQFFRLVDTAKLADGLYKLLGLGRGYKFGCMYALSQQSQIFKFKLAGQQFIFSAPYSVYVHLIHITQGGNIPVDGTALHFNPTIFPQIVHNVPGSDRVVFIGIFQKVFRHKKRFHFLLLCSCHVCRLAFPVLYPVYHKIREKAAAK